MNGDSIPANCDLFDGESMTKGASNASNRGQPNEFRLLQSPSVGGFGYTPLFLNSVGGSVPDKLALPVLKASALQGVLPQNSDLVELMLSISSHRTGSNGLLMSWMKNIDAVSREGRIRLLTGIGYILIDGDFYVSGANTSPLTWHDIQYLTRLRETLSVAGEDTAELAYLVSILLEDATQKDLSLKFRLDNVLDFNDQITVRGWIDGGRDSSGTHSEELREDYKRRCAGAGVSLESLTRTQDLSPMHNNESSLAEKEPLSRSSSDEEYSARSLEADPFSHVHVERVFGRFGFPDKTTTPLNISSVPSTPKPRGKINDDVILREMIVVDVQTDHALRRHINKAIELRREHPNERSFADELRKLVLRRVQPETPETKNVICKMAKSSEGFVHIGDVRSGANSRHYAILFKTLCDATGLYCRLVRDADDVYYNVVMLSETSAAEEVDTENRREGNNTSHRTQKIVDDREGDDDELEDAPEELVPIFWNSELVGPHKKLRLTHPLDMLLQRCNGAADPVDLDEFFAFDKLLGRGSFGEVWKVDLKVNPGRKNGGHSILIPGEMGIGPFALKLIPPEEADKEEASFMRIYRHARVINVLAVFRGYQVLENRKRELEKKPAMCILMEMADRCLETVLTGSSLGNSSPKSEAPKPFRRLDLRFVLRILIDSARAMAFLHSPVGQRPHLVHRDLKPGNVLITRDSRAIITDFGVARMNPSLETNLTVGAGTEGYMAPEQKTLLYDRPADVYSFGVIMARLLGAQQWKDATRLTAAQFQDTSADPVLVQLCLKCVQSSPLHRPSFEQIHKLLLCEFIKREFARTILPGIPETTGRNVRSCRAPRGISKHISYEANAIPDVKRSDRRNKGSSAPVESLKINKPKKA